MPNKQQHNDANFSINRTEQKALRRELRANATSAEATMWLMLKGRQVEGIKFRCQYSIGPYVLDFYSPELHLGIELDGQPHFTSEGYDYDLQRSEYLSRIHNVQILRFENKEIFLYPENVLATIKAKIEEIKNK